MMSRERIYAVTFNSHTNCLNNAVSDGNPDISKIEYIHMPKDIPLLIRERDLIKYAKFGNGYSTVKCVGALDMEGE